MNYKEIKTIFNQNLGLILMEYKSRGIDDTNILKLLLKYNLNYYGLNLKLPYEIFSDIITIENEKYKLNDKTLLMEKINEIITILSEEFNKMDIMCDLKLKDLSKIIRYEGNFKYIIVIFNIFINDIKTNEENNLSYIIQDNKNNSYYSGSNKKSIWISVYNDYEAKIFNNIVELAELLFNNNFTNIKLIKFIIRETKTKEIITNKLKVKNNKDKNFIIPNINYGLYNWQDKAYKSWEKCNCIGVIEAVTGSGKTLIAKYAIHLHLVNDYDILVIVPTVDLQEQWYRVLLDFESYGIYKLGGNNKNQSISSFRIIISVVNTATKNNTYKPRNNKGLLIADECHHYGAPIFSKALNPYFTRRMGLTATYHRLDDGIEKYLNEYFNKVCYSLTYKQALNENVIAHFKIAFIGVNLSIQETFDYNTYEAEYKDAKNYLIKNGIKYKSFGEFMREIRILCNQKDINPLVIAARRYMKNWHLKRILLADIQSKYDILTNNNIKNIIKKSNGTIIFSQFKNSAFNVVKKLQLQNITASVVEGNMEKIERKNVLAEFESGDTEVIAAPLLLDEGVDVPSSDLAIVFASHSTKRQMIQRMGRVLRKKPNDRIAKIIRIYALDTTEDLKIGAHEDFLEDIIDVADGIATFTMDNLYEILDFFRERTS